MTFAVTMGVPVRFWSKVDMSGDCWEWRGSRMSAGYGVFSLTTDRSHRNVRAHRLAWELSHGEIPPGLLVCHRCDNPGCVRPAHLFLGSVRDNARDMVSKGRGPRAKGELNNAAKLTAEGVRQIRTLLALGISQAWVHRAFGISSGNVSRIANGKGWAA